MLPFLPPFPNGLGAPGKGLRLLNLPCRLPAAGGGAAKLRALALLEPGVIAVGLSDPSPPSKKVFAVGLKPGLFGAA
jgi:hypothetical protein